MNLDLIYEYISRPINYNFATDTFMSMEPILLNKCNAKVNGESPTSNFLIKPTHPTNTFLLSNLPDTKANINSKNITNIFSTTNIDSKDLREELLQKSRIIYLCHNCDKSFTSRIAFEEHYKNSYIKNPIYTCQICEKKIDNVKSFRGHFYRHVRKMKTNNEQLINHSMDVNDNTKVITVDTSSKCPKCGKILLNKNSLTAHLKIHDTERQFLCPVCGQNFVQKINLINHSKIHTGDKPFSCEKCGKSFVSKSQLQRHQSFHSETRSFECNKCGKMFKSERNLKVHVMIHLEQRPHVCPHCNKSFLSSSKLKQHCNIHTGERPYKCGYCSKDFTNFPNWLKHIRRLHHVDHKTGDTLIKMPKFLCKKKKENAATKSTTMEKTSTKISSITSLKSTSTSTCTKRTSKSINNTITMPKISTSTANSTMDSIVDANPFMKENTNYGDIILCMDKKKEDCKKKISISTSTSTSTKSISTCTKSTCTKSTSTSTSNTTTMPKISTSTVNTTLTTSDSFFNYDEANSFYDPSEDKEGISSDWLEKSEDTLIITDPFYANDMGALLLLDTNSVDTLPNLDFQNNNEQKLKINEELACDGFELKCNNSYTYSFDEMQNIKCESPQIIEFSLNNTQVRLPPINCLKRYFNLLPKEC